MWGKLLGLGLGAAAGATSSRGYGGTKFDQMTDAGQREKYAKKGMTRLESWASGDKPLQSQSNLNRLLSGQNARLDAAANDARARATERSIQRGEGPRGGMRDKRLGEIDRSLIDAKRQQAAPLYGQAAMAEPAYRMQAQGMMLPFLQGQEEMAYGDHSRMEDLRAQREAKGSALHRALAGGAAAWGSMGGGSAGQNGGGGGGGGWGGGGGGGGYDWEWK